MNDKERPRLIYNLQTTSRQNLSVVCPSCSNCKKSDTTLAGIKFVHLCSMSNMNKYLFWTTEEGEIKFPKDNTIFILPRNCAYSLEILMAHDDESKT